jgi:nitrogen fixation protein NifX
MKVAFATSTGISIDENFKKSQSFSVWEIGPWEALFVSDVRIRPDQGSEENRLTARANALSHCAIVCSRDLSAPAAAKLVARRVHPIKTGVDTPVEVVIGKLQQVLRGTPPPWIRKAELREFLERPRKTAGQPRSGRGRTARSGLKDMPRAQEDP